MPITRYLAHQAFEPKIIETMSAAFVAACDALYLKICADPAARFVAEKVIELAQRGIRDLGGPNPAALWRNRENDSLETRDIHSTLIANRFCPRRER